MAVEDTSIAFTCNYRDRKWVSLSFMAIFNLQRGNTFGFLQSSGLKRQFLVPPPNSTDAMLLFRRHLICIQINRHPTLHHTVPSHATPYHPILHTIPPHTIQNDAATQEVAAEEQNLFPRNFLKINHELFNIKKMFNL